MWKKLNDVRCGEFFVDEGNGLHQKVGADPRDGKCIVHRIEDGAWADAGRKVAGFGLVRVVKPSQFFCESRPGAVLHVVEYDGVACVEEGVEA